MELEFIQNPLQPQVVPGQPQAAPDVSQVVVDVKDCKVQAYGQKNEQTGEDLLVIALLGGSCDVILKFHYDEVALAVSNNIVTNLLFHCLLKL